MPKNKGETDVKGYHDFRELIARDDIDIVHVATPPHWHALMAIAAAKAGKDIWCEKPMSRTIGEGVAMVKAVAETRAHLPPQHLVPLPERLLRDGHAGRADQEGRDGTACSAGR